MGNDTTLDIDAMSFASPAEAAAFADVLRACVADDALVAQFDRLTGSNLLLQGAPINAAIDRSSGRTETQFRRFAGFVYDAIWLRVPRTVQEQPCA